MFLGYGDKIIKRELTFKQYIMKRILKLYPLFFLTTILITILEIWHKHLTGKTFIYGYFDCWHFFMNLILCQDGIFGTEFSFNAPSWCISICFILYIIHFAVMYFSKEKINAIYSYIILTFIGLSFFSMGWNYPFILNPMVGRGLSCFSIGVILANIYLNSDKLNTTLIGYLSLIILTLYYLIHDTSYNIVIGNFRFVFIMIFSPLIIFSCLYVSWVNKFLSIKPMIFLGSLSMDIYLLHFIVQCIIINIDLSFQIRLNYSLKKIWLLYCFSTIIVSFIYNKYVDKLIKYLLFSLVKIIFKN
jgi:peptidoglycan/LPS O-acetylase OafA/YrhL